MNDIARMNLRVEKLAQKIGAIIPKYPGPFTERLNDPVF